MNAIKKLTEAIIRASLEEIGRYKWIESEKRGTDIGGNRAAQEWLENYYESWLQHHIKQFRALIH
jgi:hypothetical protein